jgi:hypothetical protein
MALTEARNRFGEGTYVGKSLARRSALFLTAGVTAFGVSVLPAFAQGNVGTVKIDALEPPDGDRNNQPHVGCEFKVEFFGFGEQATGTVTFAVHPPTGQRVELVSFSNVDIAGDPEIATYDLAPYLVGVYEPHPNQGFHVTLDVDVPGPPSAGPKQKTFWVTCQPPEKPPPPPENGKPTPPEEKPKPPEEEKPKPPAEEEPEKPRKPHEPAKPDAVPTAIPAGAEGGPDGEVVLTYIGLAGASAAAAVGGALYRRRHNA